MGRLNVLFLVIYTLRTHIGSVRNDPVGTEQGKITLQSRHGTKYDICLEIYFEQERLLRLISYP